MKKKKCNPVDWVLFRIFDLFWLIGRLFKRSRKVIVKAKDLSSIDYRSYSVRTMVRHSFADINPDTPVKVTQSKSLRFGKERWAFEYDDVKIHIEI